MNRNVLVTGGAGFIGSHLVDRLLKTGARVTALDNFDPYYGLEMKRANLREAFKSDGFSLVEADIRDPHAVKRAFEAARPDAVVHLAARAGVRPSVEDPGLYTHVNVTGTTHVLEAARQVGCSRFVFGSSSSVYGDNSKVPFSEVDPLLQPASPYGATKIAGEAIAASFSRCYGLPVVALRFFTVYGPRQRPDLAIHKFARLLMNGEPLPIFGDGASERDYTYVDDIVDGILAALRYDAFPDARVPYRVFNLGSDAPVRLDDLIASLSKVLDRRVTMRRLPEQTGDVRRTWADLSRSRTELGYAPRVSFVDGLSRFADWLRAPEAAT